MFAGRITRVPIACDAAAGAAAAARFAPGLRALIAGAAGTSPFLRGLVEREGDWLEGALDAAPETAFADLLAVPDGAPHRTLRTARRRVALLVALADLGGVWGLEAVTGALSDFADRALGLGLDACLAAERARGKLPEGARMTVLGMGKLGAGELNYSSDIDLVCLFDDTGLTPDALDATRRGFIRVTRALCALLSDVTADGFVFRTDLRLRPDASVTPVCLGVGAAERYYESVGRTWERAAYIKARVVAGDADLGAAFLATMVPFVWRRHLDFAAVRDAHDMRLRIREHRGLAGPLRLEGHDLKLGRGGIREIEFFTQTRQLIAGGRDAGLRDRATVPALAALAAAGWIGGDDRVALTQAYGAHREVEHRLQMMADAQTHALPTTPAAFDRLARLMGIGDTADLLASIRARLEAVAARTEGFFAPCAVEPAPDLGPGMAATVDRWPGYPALRSVRGMESFARLKPGILARLARAADPAAALGAFDGFLAGLPAGVQLFALFEANPQLVDLVVDIAATAPALARYLARHADVLDAVIGGAFFAPSPGRAALTAELGAHLAAAGDPEQVLDAARRWMHEVHFRIGVHQLRGLADAFEAGRAYADLAGAVVAALWPHVVRAFAARHGAPPGQGAAVLAMGSLGAGLLHAGSDLDLIVIYDAAGDAVSDGPRPLPARTYYARLAQALVTALTAPTAAGRLYEVDMRLRPSGRQGPVATSLAAFRDYQRAEAWTWEHLALTRARVVAGEPALGAAIEAFREALLAEKSDGATLLPDVADMRARLRSAGPAAPWDAKHGAGGLQDIELLAAATALRAGHPACEVPGQLAAGGLGAADRAALEAAWRLAWRLHAAARLLGERRFDPGSIGEAGRAFVLASTGARDIAALAAALADGAAAADAIIARSLAPASVEPA